MSSYRGQISSVYYGSAVDGPGLRCVVFFAGCNLRCPFCHNPETFNIKDGTIYSVDQLFNKLLRYKAYIKNGGVTLSGGEPFLQAEFCRLLIERLRAEGIHTAIETNGTIIDKLLIKYADLIIIDIKNYNGKIDERQKAFLQECAYRQTKIMATNVIVEGVNDDQKSLALLKNLLVSHNIDSLEFLPFKKLCLQKYKDLNLDFSFSDKNETTAQHILKVRKIYDEI